MRAFRPRRSLNAGPAAPFADIVQLINRGAALWSCETDFCDRFVGDAHPLHRLPVRYGRPEVDVVLSVEAVLDAPDRSRRTLPRRSHGRRLVIVDPNPVVVAILYPDYAGCAGTIRCIGRLIKYVFDAVWKFDLPLAASIALKTQVGAVTRVIRVGSNFFGVTLVKRCVKAMYGAVRAFVCHEARRPRRCTS